MKGCFVIKEKKNKQKKQSGLTATDWKYNKR